MDFVVSSAGDLWIDEVGNATVSRFFASTPTRQSYEAATGSRLWSYYQETEGVSWWKSGGGWQSGNYQEDQFVGADDLVGFNGTFDSDITPWYLAGPAGGTVSFDQGTLKLTHGNLGGAWSEAGNDAAYANGAGPKRITFRMRASIPVGEVQVWPFYGSAPLDWPEFDTLKFSATTEWQTYTGTFYQTLPMFTGLYFDLMTAGGAVNGTQLWIDDIHITSTELYRGGYEYEVSLAKARELQALGFTFRMETQ